MLLCFVESTRQSQIQETIAAYAVSDRGCGEHNTDKLALSVRRSLKARDFASFPIDALEAIAAKDFGCRVAPCECPLCIGGRALIDQSNTLGCVNCFVGGPQLSLLVTAGPNLEPPSAHAASAFRSSL